METSEYKKHFVQAFPPTYKIRNLHLIGDLTTRFTLDGEILGKSLAISIQFFPKSCTNMYKKVREVHRQIRGKTGFPKLVYKNKFKEGRVLVSEMFIISLQQLV